jgi:probable F420-dependent oxidoreductase
MQFGVSIFPTDYSIAVPELARAAEGLGFDSLWLPEHTHIPADRRSPWPGGPNLPREYSHSLDPFIALGMAAAVTTTLKLGTGVCLVVERDPIVTAKEVATLDFASGGRVLFGIGAGWNLEEMRHHGTDPTTRFSLMRERVQAMKAIWTQEEAEFHGRFVNFDRLWQWPKPIQTPHPPVVVGGNGPTTLKRVIAYGNEWMPIAGRGGPVIEERIVELQALARQAGRGRIPISLFGAPPQAERVSAYAELGVDRCIFGLPAAPAEEVLPRLERHAQLIRELAR